MKHPALARVFAVVLAILCLLMLANGIKGFGKADAEYAERTAFSEKYAQRIENYLALDRELADSISYEEAYEALEKLQEQHDGDASQHRTDVAMYSAEKGGYTMGADMIWEAMPEVKGAQEELRSAKAALAEKEKVYAENKGTIDSTIATANNGAAACAQESAKLNAAAGQLAALTARLPKMPEEQTAPTEPTEPTPPGEAPEAAEDPGEFTQTEPSFSLQEPTEPGEDASEEDWEEYRSAKEEYDRQYAAYESELADYQAAREAYEGQKQAYESYQAYCEELAQYQADAEAYPGRVAQYEQELADYQEYLEERDQCLQAMSEYQQTVSELLNANAAEAGGLLQSLSGDLAACAGNLGAVAQAMGTDGGAMDGGGSDFSLPGMEQMMQMPPDQILAALKNAVDQMGGAFGKISAGAAAIGGGLQEARSKVTAAEKALKEAESQLQGQLENIWYHLGELEKDKQDLEKEKTELDEQAALLSKRLVETEELKRLKNRHISARQLLINVSEVKTRAAETGDLVESAREYLEAYRQESETLSNGKRLVNLLAVLGGAAGLLGIPGAFEKLKRRVFLLGPVLLCLACAAAADGVNMSLGLGQMYTALFTAIFALIQLLIVLPKKKIPTE